MQPRKQTPLEALDRMSREHYRRAAVGVFIQENSLELLQTVVDGGEAKFYRIAGEIWSNHKFQMTDIAWAFNKVRQAVDTGNPKGVALSLLHG